MNIKRVFTAAAIAVAGSMFVTPTLAAHQFAAFDTTKVPALTFASQSRQNFYNWDIDVRHDEWRHGRGSRSPQSIGSVPDPQGNGTNTGHIVAPVPEPETYALMIAGLLAVFTVARRRSGS